MPITSLSMKAPYKAFSGMLFRCLYSGRQSRKEKQAVLMSVFETPAEEPSRAAKSALTIVLIMQTSDRCMKQRWFSQCCTVNLKQSK